jgi:hypothetical protein
VKKLKKDLKEARSIEGHFSQEGLPTIARSESKTTKEHDEEHCEVIGKHTHSKKKLGNFADEYEDRRNSIESELFEKI